jgi:hypothetical protein
MGARCELVSGYGALAGSCGHDSQVSRKLMSW